MMLTFGTTFLLKLNLEIQFFNLKPNLQIWEMLTVDVLVASTLVL